jgi:poly(3-hydroxybutyrate) depolymerase
MTNIKKLLKLFAIGYTLLMLSLPALHARSATPVDVPINSLDAGAIVKDWVILGPFPNEEIEKALTPDGCTRAGFHHDYLTELGGEIKPTWRRVKAVSFVDKKGDPTTVSPQLVETNWTGRTNLKDFFPKATFKVGYAFCRVESEVKQTVHCYIGSNDGVKVWVNGELVHSLWQNRRGLMPWEDKFQINLNKGLNTILLKCDQALFDWSFAFELFPEKPTSARLVKVPETMHHDAATLSAIRGKMEIAYRSKVDGSLQPLMLYVPPHYDDHQSWPLYVDLHGSGESHFTSKIGDPNIFDEEALQIAVWGRGPRSGYVGLSEVDILEAIDYVTEYWNVDENRIHLSGHSMGGGGTLSLIARFPDKFASGRSWAGFNDDLPLGNMTKVPLYLLHSDDDWLVPVTMEREAMHRLSSIGAKVIWDMTHGDGHAVNFNAAANSRSLAWVKRQSQTTPVSNIQFTAMDGLSKGAWWASILEWGPKRSYPTFNLSLGNENTLYLKFDNVAALSLDINSSPIDRNKPLNIFLNGLAIGTIQSPIPDRLFIIGSENRWSVAVDAPMLPKERLHFPGGVNALYHGEPLMIVWGTHGSDAVNKKIKDLAQFARATPNPGWTDKYDRHMQHSLLPGKPDTAVTDEDINQYNLILIGTEV